MKVLIKYSRSAPKNLTEAKKSHQRQLFKPARDTKHLLARSATTVSTSLFIGSQESTGKSSKAERGLRYVWIK